MREIKFRAWDKNNKIWLASDIGNDDYPVLLAVGLHGLPIAIDKDCFKKTEIIGWNRDHNIVLSQFTGLKDKNGVDIYEGDIVRHTGDSEQDYWDRVDEVKWSEKETGFYPMTIGWEWRHDVRSIEVLGNIYQNPELLTTK